MHLSSQFVINMQGTEMLSELEKESIKWFQILQQCEGDSRSLTQLVIPALTAIGTEKSSLILESAKVLSSPKFVGNMNVFTALLSARGLETLIRTIPDIATFLKSEKTDYFVELLARRSKIASGQWQSKK